jgi:hypothetical protein
MHRKVSEQDGRGSRRTPGEISPQRSRLFTRLTEYRETMIDPQYSKRDPKSDPAVPRVNRPTNKHNDWLVPVIVGVIIIVGILLYQHVFRDVRRTE